MVRGPAIFWNKETFWYIMATIVIMHNMIIDDEWDEDDIGGYNYDQDSGKVLREEEH
jgi:hypothetical protein